jgi:hypothetical protein
MNEIKLLTKGQLLPHLEDSISKAEQSIFIVGPWLDAYFARIVINSLIDKDIQVKFIVRIDEGVIDGKTLSALHLAHQNFRNFKARALENLHSKIILIDSQIFFLGSANWYWYSLNKGIEVAVMGQVNVIPDLKSEVHSYWEESSPVDLSSLTILDCKPVKEIKRKNDYMGSGLNKI